MGIDKETKLEFAVCVDKNNKLLKTFEEKNIDITGEQEHKDKPQLWITEELGEVSTEEYYYDEEDNTLVYAGNLNTINGDIFISFRIPISDIILIDLLQASIKKLNKLKTALETLK